MKSVIERRAEGWSEGIYIPASALMSANIGA
jgi:hypothetical protein